MKRRLLPLTSLRAFEAAGRRGRMTDAADELNVTHSAVSRQVRQLEATLGVDLFEGPKHAPRLTAAGRALLPGLTSAFDQIDASVRLVTDAEAGPLDVSCLGTLTMRWLIPSLHRFQAAHPRIDVRLAASERGTDLARDGSDVAIRVGHGDWPDGVEVHHLFDETIGPVAAPKLAAALGPGFAGAPLLRTLTRPHAWRDWASRSGIAIGEANGPAYEHSYFMLEAALAGLGVGLTPWPLVADDVRAGRLVALCGFLANGDSYVAMRRRHGPKKAAIFCEWLQQEGRRFQASERE
jgi:DNA-binding transcriptional LysR family regulator